MQAFFKPSMLENPWKQLEAQLAQDFPPSPARKPAQAPAVKVEGGAGPPVGQEAQPSLANEESKPVPFEGHQHPPPLAEGFGGPRSQGEMRSGPEGALTAGAQVLEPAQGARGTSLASALKDFDDEAFGDEVRLLSWQAGRCGRAHVVNGCLACWREGRRCRDGCSACGEK